VDDGLLQVFDVEHGACALLTVPSVGAGWRRIMIDCGDSKTTGFSPGQHLAKMQVADLEQLVITNLDEDHVSGYPTFAQFGININWMLLNPTVDGNIITHLKSETGVGTGMRALVHSLSRFGPPPARLPGTNGPEDALPGVGMQWFWNSYPTFDDENNLSLVLAVTFQGCTFLFPGDMEKAGFKHMLETNAGFRALMPRVDVLMASHHGRASGLYEPMFDEYGCNPVLTVISDHYKQYDSQETTSYYGSRTRGVAWNGGTRKVFTTRSDGEIRFSFRRGNCLVSCQKC
jgi:beta-lactamase superfamily II metal-dependent hydrolase